MTVDEAAEMLSLAVPTMYKLVNQNKIPFMKKNQALVFSLWFEPEKLIKLILECAVTAFL